MNQIKALFGSLNLLKVCFDGDIKLVPELAKGHIESELPSWSLSLPKGI